MLRNVQRKAKTELGDTYHHQCQLQECSGSRTFLLQKRRIKWTSTFNVTIAKATIFQIPHMQRRSISNLMHVHEIVSGKKFINIQKLTFKIEIIIELLITYCDCDQPTIAANVEAFFSFKPIPLQHLHSRIFLQVMIHLIIP